MTRPDPPAAAAAPRGGRVPSTSSTSPRVALRVALDTSAGARVLVRRDDLTAVLEQTPADGAPATATPDAGADIVTLTIDPVHVTRLAAAAWDTDADRVAAHGPWESLPDDDARRRGTIDAAHRALHYLLTGEVTPR